MREPSRDQALMETARVWAKRGTCSRLKVGAIFSIDGRILVQGYNGAPAGLPHCEHEYFVVDSQKAPPQWVLDEVWRCQERPSEAKYGWLPESGDYFYRDNGKVTWKKGDLAQLHDGCERSEHAERNGIAWAARKGIKLEGSELHVTHMPCLACAMAVVNSGIRRVVFETPYRKLEGVRLVASAGVEVVDFSSLGA